MAQPRSKATEDAATPKSAAIPRGPDGRISFEDFVRAIDGTLAVDEWLDYRGCGRGSNIGSITATFYRVITILGDVRTIAITFEDITGGAR